jgi:8-oxo-dGTP pyrophosphatase MutT (NUDIX family)
LPVTIHKGKLYFLFGKERAIDENPGWSDFGGGTDDKETFLQTAVREGGEELTGFLGSSADIKQMLTKCGTFNIDYKSTNAKYGVFRVHIFPITYNEFLPFYYNNNQRFLQKRLDPKVIRDSKIFEKAEIKWICIDEFTKMKKEFRSFYQDIIDLILPKRAEIDAFIRKNISKNHVNRKTIKTKTMNNIYKKNHLKKNNKNKTKSSKRK